MLKGNFPFRRRQERHRICHRLFLRLIQNLHNPLQTRKRRLNLCGQLGHLGQRIVDLPDIADKRLQIAHAQGAAENRKAANHRNDSDGKVSRQRNQRAHERGEKLRFKCMLLKSAVHFRKLRPRLLLPSKEQNLIVAGVQLRDGAVHIPQGILLRLKLFLADFHHPAADENAHGDNQYRKAGHKWIDGKHHHQCHRQGENPADYLGKTLLQRV